MTNLYFEEYGNGAPIIMIHGYLENGNMWKEMIKGIDNNRFILPDLLGHGNTSKNLEVNSMEAQASEIVRLMDELNIPKAKFVGHSMGGYVALTIARDFPERVDGIFLFYSKSLPDTEETKKKRERVASVVTKNKNLFLQNSIKGLFNQNKIDSFQNEIEDAIKMAKKTPTKAIISSALGMKARKDTTEVISNANFPIFIQLGKYDNAVDISYKDTIPQKENIHIKVTNTGHLGHYEALEESQSFLLEFSKA